MMFFCSIKSTFFPFHNFQRFCARRGERWRIWHDPW